MHVNPETEQLLRIVATGRDRARFLHNFCTHHIKALASGSACETFFTDVKAKVLAHGYVLALENSHQIWIRPGDPAGLLKHLNRYIITEDVTIVGDSVLTSTVYFEVDDACTAALKADNIPLPDAAAITAQKSCLSFQFPEQSASADMSGLVFCWAGQPIVAISGPVDAVDSITAKMSAAGAVRISGDRLELLRVDERFPIIGRDMTNDNLAPEAERNAAAISYTKGCYLGQEPIARLDAMGHVNKALRLVEVHGARAAADVIGQNITTSDGTPIGTLTSAAECSPDKVHGLSVMKVNALNQSLQITTVSGTVFSVKVVAS
jgi:folate-binding protein YgfZ